MGFNFRGIEHLAETRNYIQVIALMERVCGICSNIHTLTLCQAMEGLTGLTPPPRAKYIRVIMAELERLHSHVLWAGIAAKLMGFKTMFMTCFRDPREGDGRALRHQRQPGQLRHEPHRRSQSRHQRSSSHSQDGRGAGAGDGAHGHSDFHYQQNGNLALREHWRADHGKSHLLRRGGTNRESFRACPRIFAARRPTRPTRRWSSTCRCSLPAT
jgi:Ni,Fe-hydrogenase I large subunit